MGAISRNFECKILRPRENFENFGQKSAENCTQSHAPQHANARHSCSGPLTIVSKLRTTGWHGYGRDLTRFRTQNFAAARISPRKLRKFRSNLNPLLRHRTQSHAPQHANARHSCRTPLRVVSKLRTTGRYGFGRDLTRFRTQNFAAARKFRKFRSEIR